MSQEVKSTPASPPPLMTALSRVSRVVCIGCALAARFMPPVVILMMPWLLPRTCAYIMTCKVVV